MRREKQLICAAISLIGALGCGDRVVIAHEVLAQDVSSEELDAGADANARSSTHEPSHASGPSLARPITKVPVTSHPDEHHSSSSAGSESSVPDASYAAPKTATHH
jgi:hypothetical protein